MNILKTAILAGGVIAVAVTIGHCLFYRWFRWKEVFEKVTHKDRRVFYTIHVFLIPLFVLSAYLSFFHTDELARAEGISKGILIFYSLFWFCRGIWQIVDFRPLRLEMNDGTLKRMDFVISAISFGSSALYFVPLIPHL